MEAISFLAAALWGSAAARHIPGWSQDDPSMNSMAQWEGKPVLPRVAHDDGEEQDAWTLAAVKRPLPQLTALPQGGGLTERSDPHQHPARLHVDVTGSTVVDRLMVTVAAYLADSGLSSAGIAPNTPFMEAGLDSLDLLKLARCAWCSGIMQNRQVNQRDGPMYSCCCIEHWGFRGHMLLDIPGIWHEKQQCIPSTPERSVVSQEFEATLPTTILFDFPSVASLSAHLVAAGLGMAKGGGGNSTRPEALHTSAAAHADPKAHASIEAGSFSVIPALRPAPTTIVPSRGAVLMQSGAIQVGDGGDMLAPADWSNAYGLHWSLGAECPRPIPSERWDAEVPGGVVAGPRFGAFLKGELNGERGEEGVLLSLCLDCSSELLARWM